MANVVNGVTMPLLSPLPRRHYFLVEECWVYNGSAYHEPITVPKLFTSDLDTVPHIPVIFSIFKGYAKYSALLHDYLYTVCDLPREVCDRIFYKAMLEEGVPSFIAKCMYMAVSIAGGSRYKENVRKPACLRVQDRLLCTDNTIPYLDTKRSN